MNGFSHKVTFENPRAYFVELPWPAWHSALPASWTLFMPLNARPRTIYDLAPGQTAPAPTAAAAPLPSPASGDTHAVPTHGGAHGVDASHSRGELDLESGSEGVEMRSLSRVVEEDEPELERRSRRRRPRRSTEGESNAPSSNDSSQSRMPAEDEEGPLMS